MDIFNFRNALINDYKDYIESFIRIRDKRIKNYVNDQFRQGALWPNPLIQLNPAFKPGEWVDELVEQKLSIPNVAEYFVKRKMRGIRESHCGCISIKRKRLKLPHKANHLCSPQGQVQEKV